MKHIPVLKNEVVKHLNPESSGIFVDGTLGAGGHTKALLSELKTKKRKLKVIGIDCDREAIKMAEKNLADYKDQMIFVNDDFVNIKKIVAPFSSPLAKKGRKGFVSGILFDLGMSRMQLEESGRGFLFQGDEPLDMRMGPNFQFQISNFKLLTAEKVVNEYSEKKLKEIFYKYGEERYAPRIAREIVRSRGSKKIKTSKELVKIIAKAIPKKDKVKRKVHFATKVFQALRIEVNKELEKLKKVIPDAVDLLKPGGRIVIISYHSLEDRIVKQTFRELERGCTCPPDLVKCICGKKPKIKIVTKKPIKPTEAEIEKNPSARSAKMRVAEKI